MASGFLETTPYIKLAEGEAKGEKKQKNNTTQRCSQKPD